MLSVPTESRQVHRFRKRQQQKAQRVQDNIEQATYLKIKNMLKTTLSEEKIQSISRKTRFQERERELTETAILAVLMIGCSNGSEDVPVATLEMMCLYLRKWFKINIKKQSLQSRINRKETALFIKEVMKMVMSYEIDKMLSKLLKKRRKKSYMFARILIQDSTILSLPATLERIFKGCGGSASKAAVKWDYIIDQTNHLIVRLKCAAGRVPDAALSSDIMEYVQEDDLVIRDLGYFNLSNFTKLISKNVYFISRLSKTAQFFLNKTDEQSLDLIEHLEKLGVKNKGVDIDIYVGKKERLFVRLIGIKVPPEVVEKRRQQYKMARGRSQEPSESLKEWHGYTLMITNIPRNKLSLGSILKFYKVRWQIELFFKNMKSILAVDIITGKNKYRILCLMYTRLALTWIVSMLYSYAQAMVRQGMEISRFKFTRWLKDLGGFKEALQSRDLANLLDALERDCDLLCKQTKKSLGQEDEEIQDDSEMRVQKAA